MCASLCNAVCSVCDDDDSDDGDDDDDADVCDDDDAGMSKFVCVIACTSLRSTCFFNFACFVSFVTRSPARGNGVRDDDEDDDDDLNGVVCVVDDDVGVLCVGCVVCWVRRVVDCVGASISRACVRGVCDDDDDDGGFLSRACPQNVLTSARVSVRRKLLKSRAYSSLVVDDDDDEGV